MLIIAFFSSYAPKFQKKMFFLDVLQNLSGKKFKSHGRMATTAGKYKPCHINPNQTGGDSK